MNNHEPKCEICTCEFVPKTEGQTCCSKKCYSKKWRAENVEHRNEYKREYYHTKEDKKRFNLKSGLWIYRMSVKDYEELLLNQGGKCALCDNAHDVSGYRLHVDHDHGCCDTRGRQRSCGKCNRGLLCGVCNRKLGFLEKFMVELGVIVANEGTWVSKALTYIEKYKVKI